MIVYPRSGYSRKVYNGKLKVVYGSVTIKVCVKTDERFPGGLSTDVT